MAPENQHYVIRRGPGKFDFMSSLFDGKPITFAVGPFEILCVISLWKPLGNINRNHGYFEADTIFKKEDAPGSFPTSFNIGGIYSFSSGHQMELYGLDDRGFNPGDYFRLSGMTPAELHVVEVERTKHLFPNFP